MLNPRVLHVELWRLDQLSREGVGVSPLENGTSEGDSP